MTLSQMKIIKLIPVLNKKVKECDKTIIDDINKTFLTIDESSKILYKREIKLLINSSNLKTQSFFLEIIDEISDSIIPSSEKKVYKYTFLLNRVIESRQSPKIVTEVYNDLDKLTFPGDTEEFNFYELLVRVALLNKDENLVKQILEKMQNL